MTDVVEESSKTPGIVIFVAVLNFLATAFFVLLLGIAVTVLIFGNVMGIYEFVTRQITQLSPQANLSLGLNVLFGMLFAVSLFFALFYLWIGIGLLKARKIAWYFQVALSVIGLIGFPFGTILNTVILVLFFQSPVRSYFKV